jgi:hypothetical protein
MKQQHHPILKISVVDLRIPIKKVGISRHGFSIYPVERRRRKEGSVMIDHVSSITRRSPTSPSKRETGFVLQLVEEEVLLPDLNFPSLRIINGFLTLRKIFLGNSRPPRWGSFARWCKRICRTYSGRFFN